VKKENLIRFIHIKKNGGTSVYKYLRSQGHPFVLGEGYQYSSPGPISNQHIYARDVENRELQWMFCVVRNPYSRLVSFFTWCQRLPNWQEIEFSEFVKKKINTGRAKGAWNYQIDYMYDHDNNLLIDKVFRFESMTKDIPQCFGYSEPMPHLNQSTIKNWRTYYNHELATIVYEHFKVDFVKLGYDPALNSF
jgi:hypothetical protein